MPDPGSRHVRSYKGYPTFLLLLRNTFRNNRCPFLQGIGNLDERTSLWFPCQCSEHLEVRWWEENLGEHEPVRTGSCVIFASSRNRRRKDRWRREGRDTS